MKKWILSAVCAIAFSGFAAAQKIPEKATLPKESKEIKKGSAVKKETDKQSGVKPEPTSVKLPINLPPADTTSVPRGKNEQ